MFLSRRIPTEPLAYLCRSLATMLHGGVAIADALELVAETAATPVIRKVMTQVLEDLKNGQDLTRAIKKHKSRFPDLFMRMVSIGEKTGQLPEVLESLAEHYESNVRLTRQFRGEIILPILQFFAALLVIGGVIWFIGMLSEFQAPPPPGAVAKVTDSDLSTDILGWGLQGSSGAIKWFSGWAIAFVSIFVLYQLLKLFLPALLAFHRCLLVLPVVGSCLRAFAIARFSWAFHLTQNAGVPLNDSIDASLSATGNPHFISKTKGLVDDLVDGKTITEAFRRTRLFDNQYLQMVSVGESTGTVPEALNRLSPQFEDQAYRQLKLLSSGAATLIWCSVALFVVLLIFRIAAWYATMIDQGLNHINGI
ncbi:MAG: type II secretion system F family protein [Planctomycetaceae bacterium]|nr:type II secretion system F family protein [Planctomycetaceae bacterium]